MPNVRQFGAIRFTRRETVEALRALSRDSGRHRTEVVHDLITLFGPAYLAALERGARSTREAAAEVAP